MKFQSHLSPYIVRSAKAAPPVSRFALRAASRWVRRPHWVLARIASELDYFPPADTRLGNGMTIRVLWGGIVGTGILVNGFHEPHTTRVVEQIVRPGMTFFDVGAQVGQYTLLASGLVGNTGQVHSFDPDPRAFALLRHNIFRNRLNNVSANACAVGSTVSKGVETLDHYVAERGIARVDLIKIDIDGGEFDVLSGAWRLLTRDPRPRLIVEFAEGMQSRGGHNCEEMADLLRNAGYNLFCIQGDGIKPYSPWGREVAYCNVLAVPTGT